MDGKEEKQTGRSSSPGFLLSSGSDWVMEQKEEAEHHRITAPPPHGGGPGPGRGGGYKHSRGGVKKTNTNQNVATQRRSLQI